MAIDRVKKATLLVPRKETHRLINRLHGLSAVHVEDAAKVLNPPEEANLAKGVVSSEDADLNIKKLDIIQQTFGLFIKPKKGFVEGFAALPLQITEQELREVVSNFDFDPLYQECAGIHEHYRVFDSQIEQAETEKLTLLEFARMPFSIKMALELRKTTAVFGSFRGQAWTQFAADSETDALIAWEVIQRRGKEVRAIIVFLNTDADAARALLRRHGFSETALPRLPGEVEDRIHELDEDIQERREQQQAFRLRVLELANDSRRVEIAAGHWLSEKSKADACSNLLNSRRMSILTGWVRVADLPRINGALKEFPEVSAIYEDPDPEKDTPPVSLSLGRFSRPAQILVGMFGLPDYYSFDPTPWLIFSFLLFFSFCFGDVLYGLGLVVFSFVMARKYRTHAGHARFFKLFLYGGIGTMIFGALTGAWAGNLYAFLGKGNLLARINDSIPHIEPLEKPMLMLLVALGIGVVNQFYGITLLMYKMVRKGKPLDALFDGGLWLLFLPGVMLLLAPMFMPDVPGGLATAGKMLAGVGGLGLVLTQGRNEKGILAKAITGVVSLYGVLGTYGVTSFVGDVLSYSRLLALGFTTSIVAMAFNMIGSMFVGTAIGAVIFVVVLIFGHTFNFGVSILSAFVHSARLIFLEFFNRFYEGGARAFTPLSFNSDRVELLEKPL